MKNYNIAPALALSAALLVGGCSEKKADQPDTLTITNTSEFKIDVSDNPISASMETRKGWLEAGAAATAHCVVLVDGYPESTSIKIDFQGGQGYVSLNSGSTKTKEGHQQISPGYETLHDKLPECPEPIESFLSVAPAAR